MGNKRGRVAALPQQACRAAVDADGSPDGAQVAELMCSRPPGHLPEFADWAFRGNFSEYKALHDAGYNVLAYDMRNHGIVTVMVASSNRFTSTGGMLSARWG